MKNKFQYIEKQKMKQQQVEYFYDYIDTLQEIDLFLLHSQNRHFLINPIKLTRWKYIIALKYIVVGKKKHMY